MSMFTTRPELAGTFGVVASTHWLATAVGMSVLEQGGNAFDAGVATALTLQVVEPHLNGPLGDVPILIYDQRRGKPEVICGQGPAPAGATLQHYREHCGLDLVPGTGLLAPCVPGAFPAYLLLLEQYGTKRLRDVLGPAIGYAQNGYPLVPQICETIATVADLFRTHWASSAALYLPNGNVPKPRTLFCNLKHGATYARILEEAEAGGGSREAEIRRALNAWCSGFVAEEVEDFCVNTEVMDVSGRRHRGVLRAQDMAAWRPNIEEPLSYDYGNLTVYKPNSWSQSPVLLQQLALLKTFGLDRVDPTDSDFIHLWVECAKLAYADRDAFYGDPDFVDVPMEVLLSESYNSERGQLVDMQEASLELRPGKIDGYDGRIIYPDILGGISAGAGEPTVGRMGDTKGDTCHVDIIDKDGNMFTATPSGGWLQSSPVIPALGFPLGTRAQMFWLEPDHPATLAPGKRPRSTLSVGMAFRDGEPYMVWGTPGGDQQDQWNSQFLLRHVHAGHSLQEAIDAPAWHIEDVPSSFWPRQANPGLLVVEDRLPRATVEELRRRGHQILASGTWSEGRLSAAAIDGPFLKAAANPRGMQGYAAGR